jgi:hypothetical protein
MAFQNDEQKLMLLQNCGFYQDEPDGFNKEPNDVNMNIFTATGSAKVLRFCCTSTGLVCTHLPHVSFAILSTSLPFMLISYTVSS